MEHIYLSGIWYAVRRAPCVTKCRVVPVYFAVCSMQSALRTPHRIYMEIIQAKLYAVHACIRTYYTTEFYLCSRAHRETCSVRQQCECILCVCVRRDEGVMQAHDGVLMPAVERTVAAVMRVCMVFSYLSHASRIYLCVRAYYSCVYVCVRRTVRATSFPQPFYYYEHNKQLSMYSLASADTSSTTQSCMFHPLSNVNLCVSYYMRQNKCHSMRTILFGCVQSVLSPIHTSIYLRVLHLRG